MSKMKLIVAIVNGEDAALVLSELTNASFSVTKLSTSGCFLRAGNVTMLIGVEEEKVQDALDIIEEFSSRRKQQVPINSTYVGDALLSVPIEVTVGGATVFVLDVEQFCKL